MNSKTRKDEKVTVIRRDGEGISKKKIIATTELVPGDLVEVTNDMIVPADLALLYGSCVVYEETPK